MINHFRDDMPRPIIGIGHSMGGNNLINLSLMHPRLLETLVLIDPVAAAVATVKGNFGPAAASAARRDKWPSRKAAAESFKRSPFYKTWDPRVLDLWIKYGLRDLPTKLYPNPQPAPAATGATATTEPTITPNVLAAYEEKEVTLTTTKHQEVFTFMRPNLAPLPDSPPVALTHPDLLTEMSNSPFYRPEPIITYHNLPFLRPSVYYIFGENSDLSAPQYRDAKMATTGTGVSGSGGAAAGRVVDIVIKGTGHLIPMEKVEETGAGAAGWIGQELKRWAANEEILKKQWEKMPENEHTMLSARTLEAFETSGMMRKGGAKKAKL
jgi:pimeloyl-ACP methyl ester carboxylesterase